MMIDLMEDLRRATLCDDPLAAARASALLDAAEYRQAAEPVIDELLTLLDRVQAGGIEPLHFTVKAAMLLGHPLGGDDAERD